MIHKITQKLTYAILIKERREISIENKDESLKMRSQHCPKRTSYTFASNLCALRLKSLTKIAPIIKSPSPKPKKC